MNPTATSRVNAPPTVDSGGQARVAVVERLPRTLAPESCFRRLARRPGCVFFDSALRHPVLGRYSFLSADPFDILEFSTETSDPLGQLAAPLALFQAETIPELPPFQGGIAGLLSYDLNRSLEAIASPRHDEFGLPVVSLGFYDVVLAWDHLLGDAWLISQGFPEKEPAARARRARQRAEQFKSWLHEGPDDRPDAARKVSAKSLDELCPQSSVDFFPGLSSNTTAEQYLDMVRRAVRYIVDGDIFQVNLSQRLLHRACRPATQLYDVLRDVNPAPFSGFYQGSCFNIVSASPERFLRVRQGEVEVRPIKGTRRRSGYPESDLLAGYELMANPKDRSENIMIVDLMRNDLSRCCDDQSIEVTQLCGLESFASVLHLVSAVRGRVRPECSIADLLRSTFPGGSVTGAPKVRAMEIIAELEPTARGAYCGSLGYFGFDGSMDASILIRTITDAGGWWQASVGGGIVYQSEPLREYDETWAKATGMLRAIHLCANDGGVPAT
jgi:para-aminobenzoate synthetase component 1